MNAIRSCTVAFTLLLGFIPSPLVTEEKSSFFVEGYADRLSYAPGEEAGFHLSTSAPKFSVEITRIGAEAKVVWSKKDLPGKEYPVPEDASSRGCGWPESFRVPIGADWRSGYYVARFHIEDTGGRWTHRGKRTADSEAYFIVRAATVADDAGEPAMITIVTPI